MRDVLADQAAGLRNRQRRAEASAITLINTPADIALALAQALLANAQKVLLIDSLGRHTPARNTHFLFGWQQQITQKRLQIWPIGGVDVLHAPGALAGEHMIMEASASYHIVIFDGYSLQSDMALATRPQQLVIAVDAQPDTLNRAYALIKALRQQKFDWRVLLLGEAVFVNRLIATVAHFLPEQSSTLEYMNLGHGAHFPALAAKISAAAGGIPPSKTDTGEDYAQHG